MRALSAGELLGVWERGRTQAPVDRALTLLAAACPGTSREDLATLSIGRRDASLLDLREWTFGPEISGVAACPSCGDQLDFTFHVSEIRVQAALPAPQEAMLEVAGCTLRFRPPNSMDLTLAVSESDVNGRRKVLFERCLIEASREGNAISVDELPPEAMDRMAERLAETDPQAHVQLDLACPMCGDRWRATFDIVSFLWSEVEACARRILREVHTLASAYGWAEAEILALSAARRQLYLQMARA